MKKLIVVAVALVVAVGCSSMKISNDYDRQADFSQYKTYTWRDSETNVADTDPFAHERFISAVDRQLAAKGFSKASSGSDPDVVVTYHAEDKQGMSLDTTYMGGGWGYGPGWGRGRGMGMGSTTTTVRQYTIGTVVLDMWDAKEKRLVWRGTASDTVSDNPDKSASQIQKAAEKLFKNYPPGGE